MSDLQSRFEAAAQAAQNLAERPSNDTLLELYGLYKQAITGDTTGKRPGMFDMVGRAKYDAWAKFHGMTQEEAKQAYVDLVARLKGES